MAKTRKIMIVAGEASGDTHAAKLVGAMRAAEPDTDFKFFGAAGPKMRAEGVEAVIRSDFLSVVGLAEIAMALPSFIHTFLKLKRAAKLRQPDVVILVDFPDFNLKLAKTLKRKGFRIVYYISPQLWAWRKYRVRSVKKYVDLMLTILPFEKDWYARQGVEHVEYVGSPLAREVHSDVGKDEFCRKHGLDVAKPIIALLPGSRHKEIARILPVMLAAASELAESDGDLQFVIAAAPYMLVDAAEFSANLSVAKARGIWMPGASRLLKALESEEYQSLNTSNAREAIERARANGLHLPKTLKILEGETYDALNASDAAAVTSGTATLEAGIIGTPMAIVYKTSTLNYKLFEPIIDVPHYGLINLIAGKRVAKEIIQDEFTAQSLSDELLRLLEPETNAAVRAELKVAADKLGHGGASKRAAAAILNLIDS